MRSFKIAVLAALAFGVAAGPQAAEKGEPLPEVKWTFDGIFGRFDIAQLRRGYQVYSEVCAGCHSLKLVAYRNLAALGFDEEQIKEIAGEREVTGEPDADGEPTIRAALPSDRFVRPYPNDQAARAANNGALPPDLSVITKARLGEADYINALLVGYEEEPPAGVELSAGMYYNRFFPGHQIAMPAPLSEGAVEYEDGTKATMEQLAQDVTAFLTWAAEPELQERKRLGIVVVLFLVFLTALLYAVKKKVWADLH